MCALFLQRLWLMLKRLEFGQIHKQLWPTSADISVLQYCQSSFPLYINIFILQMEELLQYHSRELKMFAVTCMEKAWFLEIRMTYTRCCWLMDVSGNIRIWIWLFIFHISSWAQCVCVPVKYLRLGVSRFFTGGEYLSEILFLMSCMWCNVELRTIDSDVGFQTFPWVFFSVPLSRACGNLSCTRGLRAQ